MRVLQAILISAALAAAAPPIPRSSVEQRFVSARKSPPELYAFLLAMPKGADLHIHTGGAVYAETYLRVAAENGSCIDLKAYAIIAPPVRVGRSRCGDGNAEASGALTDADLASAVIDSLSMRDFVPGRESAHDHFFNAFNKFGPRRDEHTGDFLAEIIRRAAGQNESYLELMALNATAANAAAMQAAFDANDLPGTKDRLLANGLNDALKTMRARIDQIEDARRKALGCDSHPDSAACLVAVRYISQVLRGSPPAQAFAQILASFMLASQDPRAAGVNMVQPEDGDISMRDYHLQMKMFAYAHDLYPKVHISLHAGELGPGLVPPEGLRFHIREAVEIGHAERIGHGVDIMYETGAPALLAEMKQRRVLVEINLTSNDLILGVRGKDHPLPVYRSHGVPVALSTDDEGVSRTHLTQEYLRATLDYNLTYANLKEMVRNSLEFSFAPGASYWRDSAYHLPVSACATGRKSHSCQEFLKENEKARLQADLEDRFARFEK